MVQRRALVGLIAAGTLIAGALTFAPKAIARTQVETPKYTVEATYPSFEVRDYEPRLVAEVTVTGSPSQATNAGFRLLADFIFGNNSKRTEVAMTAPVDRTASEAIDMTAPVDRTAVGDSWVVAFTMPSKYTLATLPTPNDPRVRIRELPGQRYAVTRFSGTPTEPAVERKIADLVARIDAEGLPRTGATPTYARYDPPWTPGFLRRNEIFVELSTPPKADD